MSMITVVGRGVDTLVLNVCHADKQFQPIKQELNQDLQNELNILQNEARENESPLITRWAFKRMHLSMLEKGSHGQWRWILCSSERREWGTEQDTSSNLLRNRLDFSVGSTE